MEDMTVGDLRWIFEEIPSDVKIVFEHVDGETGESTELDLFSTVYSGNEDRKIFVHLYDV